EDGSVAARPIVVGTQRGGNWSVLEGLEAGDRVIVDGLQRVQPGLTVTVASAERAETSAAETAPVEAPAPARGAGPARGAAPSEAAAPPGAAAPAEAPARADDAPVTEERPTSADPASSPAEVDSGRAR